MYLKLFFIATIVVHFWCTSVTGQESKGHNFPVDSEFDIFITIPKNETGIDSLVNFGTEMKDRNSKLSFRAAREALSLAKEIGYRKGEADSYNLNGNMHLYFGEYVSALENYFLGFEIQKELGNEEGMARLMNNISLVFIDQKDYSKAIEYLEGGIALLEKNKQIGKTRYLLNNLGVAHREQGKYEEALEYFKKTERVALEETADSLSFNIAKLNIGNTLRLQGDFDQALTYMGRAEKYFKKNGYTGTRISSNLYLSQLYKDLHEYKTSLDYAFTSLDFAKRENQTDYIIKIYNLISELYEAQGLYKDAYDSFHIYHQISDSIFNLQRSRLINEMQVRHEVEQKDKEIIVQEARIVQQELSQNFLLAGLALFAIIVGLLFKNNYQKKKSNQQLHNRKKEIEAKNDQLSKLNLEKDEFMSIAAHDLRNPISVVISASELLQYEESITKENIEEYTNLINIAGQRMLNLINDLLKIELINQGQIIKKKEEIEINKPLLQSIYHFKHSAKIKNVKLTATLDDHTGLIMADENVLTRIFDNLISNAVKYSRQNSEIFINSQSKGDRVLVMIKDEGPGLTSEDQKKLFKRFARLSASPTGNETSTGLGLYIVKKLVLSLNGKIWCESAPGKGAAFYIEFPGI